MHLPCVLFPIAVKSDFLIAPPIKARTKNKPLYMKRRNNPAKIGCPISWKVLDLSNLFSRLLNEQSPHIFKPTKKKLGESNKALLSPQSRTIQHLCRCDYPCIPP